MYVLRDFAREEEVRRSKYGLDLIFKISSSIPRS